MIANYQVRVNGCTAACCEKPSQVLGTILSVMSHDLQYISLENLKHRIRLSCELTESKRSRRGKMLAAVERAEEKDVLIQMIYNEILNSQGLSVLPGFGYAKIESVEGKRKVTSRFLMNAEKDSIRKPA